MKRFLACVLPLALLVLVGASAPALKGKPAKISISTGLDKTAIWVGDTLQYTVRALHDKDVGFIVENLKKETLNLAPFVVRDIDIRQGSYGSTKNLFQITLSLTTYESGKLDLRIPSFGLYYFVHEPGFDKRSEAQAETIAVPATRVGLRSTLVGDNLRLREGKLFSEVRPQEWIVPLVFGVLGMTFLAVQTGKRVWTLIHTQRPKRRHLSPRARDRKAQEFLNKIRAQTTDDPEDQARFYGEISQFLRNYVNEWLDIDASGLTPEEIKSALAASGSDGVSAEPLKAILEKCDQVLYTKHGFQLGKKWRQEVEQQLENLLHHRA
jgi:hypothetical protein